MLSRNEEIGSMGTHAGLHMFDVIVKKFTFAISSPDEFLVRTLQDFSGPVGTLLE